MSVEISRRRRKLVLAISIVFPATVLCAFIAHAWIRRPLPLPPAIINKGTPWESQRPVYDGEGTLVAFMGEDAIRPEGSSVRYEKPLSSNLLGEDRPILVYLPPGYDEEGPHYPVMFALHGYSSRPQSWANLLLDPLERAFAAGTIPPLVVVMPDFSISGNGTDDPTTWFDDRSGSFCINSNLGRFEDHFFQEIVPFVFSTFNVRTDPEGVVLMGSSMGGYCVLYYGVRHPSFSHILVPIYPSADLRYGVHGDKLADFDPTGYALIRTDDPNRIVNGTPVGGFFGVTEEWLYYPVFDSDWKPGAVWSEDRPVWERLSEANPVEMLDAGDVDLSGQRYYILVGSADDFNFNAHIPLIVPRLTAHGAEVFPATNIVPGGRHKPAFILAHIDEIMGWIGGYVKGR
jgi:S-formylglutathione hydrolase FrmB